MAGDGQDTCQFQPASSKLVNGKSASFVYLTIKSVLASVVFVKKIHFKGTVICHGERVSGINR
jgi:hypothetical protein